MPVAAPIGAELAKIAAEYAANWLDAVRVSRDNQSAARSSWVAAFGEFYEGMAAAVARADAAYDEIVANPQGAHTATPAVHQIASVTHTAATGGESDAG